MIPIIILTETWLCDANKDTFTLPNYNCVSLSRNQHGGGISVYYLEKLVVNIHDVYTGIFDTHEALFLRITYKANFPCLLGCFYRPPSRSLANFNEYLNSNFMSNDLILKNKCIFVGDFNIDYLQINKTNS